MDKPQDRRRAAPASATRRGWLAVAVGAAAAPGLVRSASSRQLRVGVEPALKASGLAARLATALARDTGLLIEWQTASGAVLLPQLERGELDAALTHDPRLEADLLAQGLIHDHRAIATTELVLVGPAPRRAARGRPASGDPAGLLACAPGQDADRPAGPKSRLGGPSPARPACGQDAAEALGRIATSGARGEAVFLSCAPAGGARQIEESLWQAAGVAPEGPWRQRAHVDPITALALAGSLPAYTLAERGVWESQRRSRDLALVVAGDPRLALTYHLTRSFRSHAPAVRLMAGWLGGSAGRRTVADFGGGYRAPG